MSDLRYVVTTSRRTDPGLTAAARAWAERLGVPFVRRAARGLAALCREEGVHAALTVTPVRVGLVIPAEGVEYFFHPSMARTRIRNIRDGTGDPMVAAMQLKAGDTVLDCTLGRACDATVASWVVGEAGRVVGYEADPLVAALTIEGLRDYEVEGRGVQEAMRRIDARHGDCVFEETIADSQAMQPLRRIGVHRPMAPATFEQARRATRRAVVIKQRRGGAMPALNGLRDTVTGGGSSIEYVVLDPV